MGETKTYDDNLFFRENEIKNNQRNGRVLIWCGCLLFLSWMLYKLNIWHHQSMHFVAYVYHPMIICCLGLGIYCQWKKGQGKIIKYLVLMEFIILSLILGMISSSVTFLIPLIPVVISCGYYFPRLTLYTSILSGCSMVAASFIKLFVKPVLAKDIDVRFIVLPKGTTITFHETRLFEELVNYDFDKMKYLYTQVMNELIPAMICLLVLSSICYWFSKKGKEAILQQRKEAEQRATLEVELSENRTRALVSQIRPHFIFNVLNCIYELCEEDTKMAQEAIDDFSTYLRGNIDSLGCKTNILFSKELDHIENYVNLEQMRFGDRINVEYDIDTENFMIPPLTIQPLVENAIKHGICRKMEGGTVRIITREHEDSIEIIIADDGVGFDPSLIESLNIDSSSDISDYKKHVGLQNAKERLRTLSDADFEIYSAPGKGSRIHITIPKNK